MLIEKMNVLKSRASNSRTVFPKGPWNHLSRPHHLETKEQTDDFSVSFSPYNCQEDLANVSMPLIWMERGGGE